MRTSGAYYLHIVSVMSFPRYEVSLYVLLMVSMGDSLGALVSRCRELETRAEEMYRLSLPLSILC